MVSMADVLVVAVFDDEKTAWDAVVTASTIAAQGKLGLHDATLVVRAPDGTVHKRQTHDISTTKGRFPDWGVLGLGELPGTASVISSFRCHRGASGPEPRGSD